MVTKILLILSALVTGGALYLGIQNRSAIVDARLDRNNTNGQIKTLLKDLTGKKSDIQERLDNLVKTNTDLETKIEQVKSAESEISDKTDEIGALTQEIEAANAEIQRIDLAIEEALGGSSIDEFQQDLDNLKKEVAEAEQVDASLASKIDATQSAIANNQGVIKNFKSRQASRSAAISRNSLEASIIDVDQDWGFVVINAGSNRGIEPDSQLLVRRGDQNVGKLTITSIEKTQTIADIVLSSVPSGGRILKGDRVLFEKPRG